MLLFNLCLATRLAMHGIGKNAFSRRTPRDFQEKQVETPCEIYPV